MALQKDSEKPMLPCKEGIILICKSPITNKDIKCGTEPLSDNGRTPLQLDINSTVYRGSAPDKTDTQELDSNDTETPKYRPCH